MDKQRTLLLNVHGGFRRAENDGVSESEIDNTDSAPENTEATKKDIFDGWKERHRRFKNCYSNSDKTGKK